MSANKQIQNVASTPREPIPDPPLSVLLSQALVAFTVELDDEFERQMGEAGYPGARLSLAIWLNLIRFISTEGTVVSELVGLASQSGIRFELGCLERWRFVELQPAADDPRPVRQALHRRAQRKLRDGWGSGRGIRAEWIVRLTAKGHKAREIWLPLMGAIEQRWQARFGDAAFRRLRQALQLVASRLDVELPHGLPSHWTLPQTFPPRVGGATEDLPLATLLAQILLAFRIEFDRHSGPPLPLCASTLRVLGENPVPVREIPRLTGGSPETTDFGWQLKPYVILQAGPAGSRGKAARLTPLGLHAQQEYFRLLGEIQTQWEGKFGKQRIRELHQSLRDLLGQRNEQGLRLVEGLIPPPGVVRAGSAAAALGRRDVGAAARQRARDLVAQTQEFVRDPQGTLPHYPLWDMNRGFGP